MKTKLSLLIAVSLLVAATADAKVRIVSTLSDFASIARAVGGDRVEVDYIADGRQDPHYVEVLPSYMLKVKKADLFLWAGLDLEPWARGVVDGARNKNLVRVDCSHGVQILEIPTGKVDASQGDIHASGNPHYWLDPANGKVIAQTIVSALEQADPEGTAQYEAQLVAFNKALDAKLKEWSKLMEPFDGADVVYFHNSWPYFNQAFGLNTLIFIEPKPGVDPSPGHTANVVALMKEKQARVIVKEPYFSAKTPESIAHETDATVVVLAGSVGGIPNTDDYFSLFDQNLAVLREALQVRP